MDDVETHESLSGGSSERKADVMDPFEMPTKGHMFGLVRVLVNGGLSEKGLSSSARSGH